MECYYKMAYHSVINKLVLSTVTVTTRIRTGIMWVSISMNRIIIYYLNFIFIVVPKHLAKWRKTIHLISKHFVDILNIIDQGTVRNDNPQINVFRSLKFLENCLFKNKTRWLPFEYFLWKASHWSADFMNQRFIP